MAEQSLKMNIPKLDLQQACTTTLDCNGLNEHFNVQTILSNIVEKLITDELKHSTLSQDDFKFNYKFKNNFNNRFTAGDMQLSLNGCENTLSMIMMKQFAKTFFHLQANTAKEHACSSRRSSKILTQASERLEEKSEENHETALKLISSLESKFSEKFLQNKNEIDSINRLLAALEKVFSEESQIRTYGKYKLPSLISRFRDEVLQKFEVIQGETDEMISYLSKIEANLNSLWNSFTMLSSMNQ